MDNIEAKALALVNEIAATRGTSWPCVDRANDSRWEALCRAIEQHEAFRQEVSDAVVEYFGPKDLDVILAGHLLERFIIPKPKPDPLVDAMAELAYIEPKLSADKLRAALDARGLEIREKGR